MMNIGIGIMGVWWDWDIIGDRKGGIIFIWDGGGWFLGALRR